MLKLHKIDNRHIQFSTPLDDLKYNKEDLLYAIEEYGYKCDESKSLGFFGKHGLSKNRSHYVETIEVDEENGWVHGTIQLIDTPKGKQVMDILKNNLTQYLNMDFRIDETSNGVDILSIDFLDM